MNWNDVERNSHDLVECVFVQFELKTWQLPELPRNLRLPNLVLLANPGTVGVLVEFRAGPFPNTSNKFCCLKFRAR